MHRQFREMDRMMNAMMDPFGMLGGMGMLEVRTIRAYARVVRLRCGCNGGKVKYLASMNSNSIEYGEQWQAETESADMSTTKQSFEAKTLKSERLETNRRMWLW